MSHAEFRRWQQFTDESPIGDDRCFDLPAAMSRHHQAVLHGDPKRAPPRLDDFVPNWSAPVEDLDTKLLRLAELNRARTK